MSGAPGERLGPYELVSRIGAGGMGEVWRARDTRLERSVAVKMLPAAFADDAQLRTRFAREALTISRLDHPNICALYDVGENFLVMELLEGETLADRIARGPLPLADVTRYGGQIADALDRAHRAGVVHRDVKPGNVVITRVGAKLLDFGLAKSAVIAGNPDDATQQKPLTREGTIVGTFQYMAPEQLEGIDADARTDIFALGALLYEMTTGKRAFEGKTRTSLIAAIVSGDPRPVSELQPLTPPALEHVISKCLSKDPDQRWQSAHDVAEELRWIGSGAHSGVARVAVRKPWLERVAWIAALLAALGVVAWITMRPGPAKEVIEAAITTDGNDGLVYAAGPPAFSPDGKQLAYVAADPSGRRSIWIRSLDRGTARPVGGTNDAYLPFWSADGRFIAFTTAGGELKKVAIAGGEPELLARGSGGWTWNRDDVVLFPLSSDGFPISAVPAAGGEPKPVLKPEEIGALSLGWPFFLPDGNHFLVLAEGGAVQRNGQAGLWVATLDRSEKPQFLTRASTNAAYVEPGYLLFGRDNALRAQKFDARTLQLSGEAVVVAPAQIYLGMALFSASSNGLLVYQPTGNTPRTELRVVNRKGEPVGSFGTGAYHWAPNLSPDGRRVASERNDESGSNDVWIAEANGEATRVSFSANNASAPVWSPDGNELVYAEIIPPARYLLFRKRLGESPRQLFDYPGMASPGDWSPDGRHLTIDRSLAAQPDVDMAVWALEEAKWIEFAATKANEGRGTFSPDGKWIAYQSDESGRFEIYVQPFPATGAKYQVSLDGGMAPRWSRRGEIVWVDASSRLTAAKVETAPAFRAARPETLFPVEQRNPYVYQYDVAPDGNFVVNTAVRAPARPMTLVMNWTARISK